MVGMFVLEEHLIKNEEELLVLLRKIEEVIEKKLANFRKNPPKKNGSEIDILFQIFKKNSRVPISELESKKIKNVLDFHIKNQTPIPVVLLWAYGGQALSPLKFCQPEINLPRLGDIWGLLWWKIFNFKIQFFHPPGIKLVLIDEKPLLKILGWGEREIEKRSRLVQKIASFFELDFIYFENLPIFKADIKVNVCDQEVIAILVSLPSSIIPIEKQKIVFEFLYLKREKPISYFKREMGEFWEKAKELREKMVRITEARKKVNWVEKIVGEYFVDACLTEKGRFSPDIWGYSFPQHGGSLLNTDWDQRFSVSIIPEFRLLNTEKKPVWILPQVFSFFDSEFEAEEKSKYIFYWI